MSVSKIFGMSYDIMRKNPGIIIPQLVFYLLNLTISGILAPLVFGASFGLNLSSIVTILVLVLIMLMISTVFLGLYINVADQGYKGEVISLNTAFDVAKNKYLTLLPLEIVLSVISFIVLLIVLAFGVFVGFRSIPNLSNLPLNSSTNSTVAINNVLQALGPTKVLLFLVALFVAGIPLYILFEILFYQAAVAVVLEEKGVLGALKRSIEIGGSNSWMIFKIVVCAFIISGIIFLVAGGVASVIVNISGLGAELFQLLVEALVALWVSLMPVIFYYEYITKKPDSSANQKPSVAPKQKSKRSYISQK